MKGVNVTIQVRLTRCFDPFRATDDLSHAVGAFFSPIGGDDVDFEPDEASNTTVVTGPSKTITGFVSFVLEEFGIKEVTPSNEVQLTLF